MVSDMEGVMVTVTLPVPVREEVWLLVTVGDTVPDEDLDGVAV
jgi:hypothetical protein